VAQGPNDPTFFGDPYHCPNPGFLNPYPDLDPGILMEFLMKALERWGVAQRTIDPILVAIRSK